MDASRHESIALEAGGVGLTGDLVVPEGARGMVVFAHGSGSSRLSPRNQRVAARLQADGFGTLLFDLLTEDEERIDTLTRELRFDVVMLGARLTDVVRDLSDREETTGLPIGCFGASTGAAAALIAAAEAPDLVASVVSRGGRPDLAADALASVQAPTLLIVGGRDTQVLELNRAARARMHCEVAISVVPGAGHLFEERGALGEVARLAGTWFQRTL